MENEKRLIDAYALEKAIRTDYFEHFTQYHDTDQIALIDMVCEDIEESPTVDAVEVVRCKDCIYAYRIDGPREEYDCRKMSAFAKFFRPEHFCSYGERKDGDKL